MALEKIPRIAILASGRGSNFSAIARAIDDKKLTAEIAMVISDRSQAVVLQKARERDLPTLVEKNQKVLLAVLQELKVDYVVLAGFMRILNAEFIQSFMDPRGFARIVNIHPSLLPAYPGLESYKRAFEDQNTVTGVTVHFVDGGVDTGPICAQRLFSIEGCQSVEEVEARGLKVEHELYPETLQWILQNKFEIAEIGGKLHVQAY